MHLRRSVAMNVGLALSLLACAVFVESRLNQSDSAPSLVSTDAVAASTLSGGKRSKPITLTPVLREGDFLELSLEPGQTRLQAVIQITLRNSQTLRAVTIPLAIGGAGRDVFIDSVSFVDSRGAQFETRTGLIDSSKHSVLIGLVGSLGGDAAVLSPGSGVIARIYLTAAKTGAFAQLRVEPALIRPYNTLKLVTKDNSPIVPDFTFMGSPPSPKSRQMLIPPRTPAPSSVSTVWDIDFRRFDQPERCGDVGTGCSSCGSGGSNCGLRLGPVETPSGQIPITFSAPSSVGRNGLGLDLCIHYHSGLNSVSGIGGFLGTAGNRWLANYIDDRVLLDSAANIVRIDPALQRRDIFTRVNDSTYTSPCGFFVALRKNPGNIQVLFPSGMVYTYFLLNGSPTQGRLISMSNRLGDSVICQYDTATQRLTGVYDPFGRRTAFWYAANGRLDSIVDHLGRATKLTHDSSGNVIRWTTPPVTGVPGNTYPLGKTTEFKYDSWSRLVAIINPNQVAEGIDIPQETFLWDDTPGSLDSNRVVSFMLGWDGFCGDQDCDDTVDVMDVVKLADHVFRGGVASCHANLSDCNSDFSVDGQDLVRLIDFVYRGGAGPDCTRYRPDANAGGGTATIHYSNAGGGRQVSYVNANGDRSVHVFDAAFHKIADSVFTNRVVSPFNDPVYVSRSIWSPECQLTSQIMPRGNHVRSSYDTANPDPRGRANLLQTVHYRDAIAADQDSLVSTFSYEPIFNQVLTATDARGNDPMFHPPIGLQSSARYTTRYIYDYMEGTQAQVLALAAAFGISLSPAQAAGLALNRDVNADGITNQQKGNLIEVDSPPVIREGGETQFVAIDYQYDSKGQPIRMIDGEGYVQRFEYYPENDPDGDSVFTPNPPGRILDTQTGGYLKRIISDDTTLIRTPAANAPRIKATQTFKYNAAGSIIKQLDPRGIATFFAANSLNQTYEITRGVVESLHSSEDAARVKTLDYHERIYRDANDNVIQRDIKNSGDTVALTPSRLGPWADTLTDPVNPWITTRTGYTVLNQPAREVQEISGGESYIGPQDSALTWHYYDNIGRSVLEFSPVATLPANHAEFQRKNISSRIADERGLVYKSTRGGIDAEFTAKVPMPVSPFPINPTNYLSTSTDRAVYDRDGNLVKSIDAVDHGSPNAEGGDVDFQVVDAFGRTVSHHDAMGNVDTTSYDPVSNVIRTASYGPAGADTLSSSVGNVRLREDSTKYDELNRAFRYEAANFRIAGPTNDPAVTEYIHRTIYDRNSRVTITLDPLGQRAETEYNGMGWVIRSLDQPLPKVSNPSDSVRNEVLFTRNQNGDVTKTKELERSPAIAQVDTFTTRSFYDALGREVQTVSNMGNCSRARYNSRNQVMLASDPMGSDTTEVMYSQSVPTNKPGNTSRSVYDNLGRLISEVRDLRCSGVGDSTLDLSNPANPDGKITITRQWDHNSRSKAISDDRNSTTRYRYTERNLQVAEVFADGTTDSVLYDADNVVTRRLDNARDTFNITVDDLHRVKQISISRASGFEGTTWQKFVYDGLSRQIRSEDNNDPADLNDNAICEYSYDSYSRTAEERQGKSGFGTALDTVTTFFSPEGNHIQMVYPSNPFGPGRRRVTRGYDGLNRLARVEEGAGTGTGDLIQPTGNAALMIATYSYMGPGRVLERRYPNGTRMTFLDNAGTAITGYDGDRRVIEQRDLTLANSVVVGFDYGYSRAGQRLYEFQIHHPTDSAKVLNYDSQNRLIKSFYSVSQTQLPTNNRLLPVSPARFDSTTTWQLDGVNNWAKEIRGETTLDTTLRIANEMNEYTTVRGISQTSDENGNLTDDGTNLFRYDAFNRLTRVLRRSDSALIGRYLYDAARRRIERRITNSGSLNDTVRYVYSGWQVVEEQSPTRSVDAQYVDGGMYIDEHLQMIRRDIPGKVYYHTNVLFSTVGLTDSLGKRIEGYEYDAYGNHLLYRPGPNGVVDFRGDDIGSAGGASAVGNPYSFTGQQVAPEAGSIYSRNRQIIPTAGRFLQRDPLSVWGDRENLGNGYTYNASSPNDGFDPFGLQGQAERAAGERLENRIRLRKIREMLAYEKEYGTWKTCKKYSNTFGSSPMGTQFDNKGTHTIAGTLDFDWWMDLCFGIRMYRNAKLFSPPTLLPLTGHSDWDELYVLGKKLWKETKKRQGQPWGEPYVDPKEQATLRALEGGYTTLASLFPEEFLKEQDEISEERHTCCCVAVHWGLHLRDEDFTERTNRTISARVSVSCADACRRSLGSYPPEGGRFVFGVFYDGECNTRQTDQEIIKVRANRKSRYLYDKLFE